MTAPGPYGKRHHFSKSQQEQFCVEDAEAEDSSINNVCAVYWLDSRYSDAIIEKAVNLVLEHEQAPRLRIAQGGDEYFQYEVPYSYEKLPSLQTSWSKDEIVEKTAEDAVRKRFVLEGPMYDLLIIRGKGIVGLRSLFSHLIMDGMSMGLWGQMITSYCQRLFDGEEIVCTDHFFTDSIDKEDLALAGNRQKADKRYWAEKMHGWEDVCKINPIAGPSKHPAGKRLTIVPDATFIEEIYAYCSAHSFSPAILFRTALTLYLSAKNPGMKRIDFGETISNRKDGANRQMLGNFALEILVCVPVDDENATIEELHKAIKKAGREAYYHSLFSYEDVLEMVQKTRPDVTTLRDVQFGYIPPVSWDSKVHDCFWLANESPEASLEFIPYSSTGKEDLAFLFDYRKDVFTPAEAEALAQNILALIRACMNNPKMTLREARNMVG